MSTIRKNVLFELSGQALLIVLGLISFKFIYANLGQDAVGLIYFTIMLSAILMSVLEIGLTKTTIREVASHIEKDPQYIDRLSQTFSLFYWSAYIAIVFLFVAILPDILDSWISLSSMDESLAYKVLLVLGVSGFLVIPKMLYTSLLIGLERLDICNIIEVIFAVLQQAGLIVMLVSGAEVLHVAWWIAVINCLKIIVYMVYTSRYISGKSLLPSFSVEVFRRVRSYAGQMMWISLSLLVHKQLDKVLLSKFLPIGAMGVYSFAYSSLNKTTLMAGAVTKAAFPSFSKLDEQNRGELLIDRYHILQNILVYCTVPVFAFVLYFAAPIFTFLMDEAMAEKLQVAVIILVFSFYMSTVLRLVRAYMFAIGTPGPVIKADVLSLFILIPSTILLVYNFGLEGAAISSLLYYIVMALYLVPITYRKFLGSKASIWLRAIMTALLLSALIYLSLGYIVAVVQGGVYLLLTIFFIATSIYIVIIMNVMEANITDSITRNIPFLSKIIIKKGVV